MKTKEKEIYYLNELSDYEVDTNYSDVRGWVVKDAALRNIGTIKNLLVNKKLERVVYLDVEVDASIIDAKHDPYGGQSNPDIREFMNEEGQNHIIIPIGLVDINTSEDYVYAELIDHLTFAETKRIRRDTTINRDYEDAVLNSYKRKYSQPPTDGTIDRDIENADVYKKERINEVERLKKMSENSDAGETMDQDNRVLDDGEEFYGRSEFDDSRFYRGKR